MHWDESSLKHLPKEGHFRIRGIAATRLETFIDAAFAFATTLLVISVGSLPNNYSELINALKAIPTFAASFAIIAMFWLGHRNWSRRYGIEDNFSILISLILIFIILIYVYPLKVIASSFFAWVSGGYLPSAFRFSSTSELPKIFTFYGIGFGTLSFTLALLYWRALRMKLDLQLSTHEALSTKAGLYQWIIPSCVGYLSALFAAIMPLHIAVYSGFFYFILAISSPLISMHYDKLIAHSD